jgi:NTE family protein
MTKKITKQEANQTVAGKKKKVAFALQGGGAHGAFTWGVMDRILEDGRFEIEGLSGTSAGGMNAAAIAQGLFKGGNEGARETLKEFWMLMSKKGEASPLKPTPIDELVGNYGLSNQPIYTFLNILQGFLSPYQLNPMNLNPLKDFVSEFFDFQALTNPRAPKVFLCATHVRTGKLKIFSGKELSIKSLLASACLPFMFQAVEVGGEYYWDGGFIGNPAIFPLINECETSDIIIIQLTQSERAKLPTTAREIIDRHKEITYNNCLVREMRAIAFITDLIDKGIVEKDKLKRLHIHVIRNEETFENLELSSAMNTSKEFLEHLFQEGRKTADAWIKKHFEDIGKKGTTDMEKYWL